MDINESLQIPEEELHWTFARSGGPGGQNVNKVASKAVMHWDLHSNTTVPKEVKNRLIARQRNRITTDGQLVVQGQRFRDQAKNVEDCRERLRDMILEVLYPPKPRRATKPTRGSKERRLSTKRQQSQRKASRRRPFADE